MMYEVKQFKLVSGEEILAEVIEWADGDFPEIIVRNALQIDAFYKEDPPFEKYYAFKPYLHCLDGSEDIIILNSTHVLATAIPHEELIDTYIEARQNSHKVSIDRRANKAFNRQLKLKEVADQMRSILESTMEEVSAQKTESNKEELPDNIIPFPYDGDDIIH